jgi:ribosome-associated translation inhibitor RaiA
MAQFQMTFRGMTPSEALRAVAQEKFTKISKWFGGRATCSVVIDQAWGRKNGFSARVEFSHRGQGVHVSAAAEHEFASAALREAFVRAISQLASSRWAGSGPKRKPRAPLLLH